MVSFRNWKRLEPATVEHRDYDHPKNRIFVELQMEQDGSTWDQAVDKMEAYDRTCSYWKNDLYQVQKREFYCDAFKQTMVHLNIRRLDGAAVFDWRHRQWIKNQLVGEECEAFELYPAESRLVDTSNKYHLWVFVDPVVRMPVGMEVRDVVPNEVRTPSGMRQRRM